MDARTLEAVQEIPRLLRDLSTQRETANLLALADLELRRENKAGASTLIRTARARLGVNIDGERVL
jgi:hypothetical protein